MKKKKEKLFGKAILWIMLVMIAVGFTIPTFFNDEQDYQNIQPRICRDDADCYLLCDGQPKAALCYQNLCQQNTCQEDSGYQDVTLNAELIINIEGDSTNLLERSEQMGLSNFFVQFQENSFTSFADLDLNQVLDKLAMRIDSQCLAIGSKAYCQEEADQLQLIINGERSYSFGGYLPQEGDHISIIYFST